MPVSKDLTDGIEFRYRNRLAPIYDEISYLQQQETSPVLAVIAEVIWDEMQSNVIPITLEGTDQINADVLSQQIAPFMQSVQGLQQVHTEITEQKFRKPRIIQIHNESTKIELIGAEGILRFLRDIFDKRKRGMDYAEQEANIENVRAKSADTLSQIQARRVDQAMKLADWEATNLPKYLQMAEDYLRTNYPHLNDEQRIFYAPRIANDLIQITLTRLELRFGWHDLPRPNSLPK